MGQDNCSNDSQAIHQPRSKCEMSHVIRTWQETQAIATQVWQICAGWRGPPPRWQRQRLVLRRWQTDMQQIVSETPFRVGEHTHDRWDGRSSRVSRAREDGQLERCARALEGTGVKLTKKQIKDGYIVCVHTCLCGCPCLCFLPQIPFVGSIFDVVTDVVVHSMSSCAVSSIKNLKCEFLQYL